MYQALDDRPGQCEGCNVKDYPSQYGPSAKQLTWNAILNLWLCVDCQYTWSNWYGTQWIDEKVSQAKKPGFLIVREKNGTG